MADRTMGVQNKAIGAFSSDTLPVDILGRD